VELAICDLPEQELRALLLDFLSRLHPKPDQSVLRTYPVCAEWVCNDARYLVDLGLEGAMLAHGLRLLLRLDLSEQSELFFPSLQSLDVQALPVVDYLLGGGRRRLGRIAPLGSLRGGILRATQVEDLAVPRRARLLRELLGEGLLMQPVVHASGGESRVI
jgi:hypothetical protein